MNHKPRRVSSKSAEAFAQQEISASATRRAMVERIRNILGTKDLTLYGVAARTRLQHPREPVYHLPHNFYFQLQSSGLTPTLYQLSALSEQTNYRFTDWLRVFGFRLGNISRLQAALPRPRTALLESTVQDSHANIPWFRDRLSPAPIPPVAPLSQLLEPSGALSLSSLSFSANSGAFRYAKIGQEDAFAFPDLIPGSIVRADSRLHFGYLPQSNRENSNRIFLIEHSRGFFCSRLHFGSRNNVTLAPTQLPFANIELALGSQARILGVVDLEFRPLTHRKKLPTAICSWPEVAPSLARLWEPELLKESVPAARPAYFLRDARVRAALSLRTASFMSRDIAKMIGDDRYFISPGSLSDYEANDTPPRHIHKLLTLSILYAVSFQDLLRFFGIDLLRGAKPIPEEWMPGREERDVNVNFEKPRVGGFLSNVLNRLSELPLFLHEAIASLAELSEISLHDIFWIEGQPKALHPALAGGLFVIVNRRKTTPPTLRRKSLWEQPLYLLLRRDGSYLLANCTREGNFIVLHPYTSGFAAHERLRDRVDAEVIGQIVAVVRSHFPR